MFFLVFFLFCNSFFVELFQKEQLPSLYTEHKHIKKGFFQKRFFRLFKKKKKEEKKKRKKTKKSLKKKNHPGTKLIFPARLPTSLSTSLEFHSQVRDGLAWFH